jgi:hypothetical protein
VNNPPRIPTHFVPTPEEINDEVQLTLSMLADLMKEKLGKRANRIAEKYPMKVDFILSVQLATMQGFVEHLMANHGGPSLPFITKLRADVALMLINRQQDVEESGTAQLVVPHGGPKILGS